MSVSARKDGDVARLESDAGLPGNPRRCLTFDEEVKQDHVFCGRLDEMCTGAGRR